jgi:hypothetical protein
LAVNGKNRHVVDVESVRLYKNGIAPGKAKVLRLISSMSRGVIQMDCMAVWRQPIPAAAAAAAAGIPATLSVSSCKAVLQVHVNINSSSQHCINKKQQLWGSMMVILISCSNKWQRG